MRIPMNLLSIAGAAGVWASSGLLVLLSVLGTAGAASAQAGSGIADAARRPLTA
jgi:hypothetical protein